jgi:hypothetical protein
MVLVLVGDVAPTETRQPFMRGDAQLLNWVDARGPTVQSCSSYW